MSGIFFIGLDKVPHVKHALGRFLESHPSIFSLIGMGFLSVGVLLFVVMFSLYKKVFYQVKMDVSSVVIDPALIQGYVNSCLAEVLPNISMQCEVVVRKDQAIEIITKLPATNIRDHKDILSVLEMKLGSLFKEKLGYTKEFFFTVSIDK